MSVGSIGVVKRWADNPRSVKADRPLPISPSPSLIWQRWYVRREFDWWCRASLFHLLFLLGINGIT